MVRVTLPSVGACAPSGASRGYEPCKVRCAGIAQTIRAGVSKPKAYRSPMPPLGGTQLSRREVQAVAAYVWGLSHRS